MATLYIDDHPYTAPEGQDLLLTCLSLGFDVPYFCWHPALGAVGACRQCAVKQFKDDSDTRGRLVMACMTPVADGMRIALKDREAAQFRAEVIEWLMTNHPHDCPVCDEGGECHLQDMTVMTGHTYRRFRFPKRTFRNQDLGPFLTHEMNRCITCYRCVRFYGDYAGGTDLHALASKNHVYFGRHCDGALENEFSGNLVEVCPTGVFTDKTLERHYTRKWDLQGAPSICVHCAVGCNITPGERYGTLRRVHNRYNGEVNGYFLCDRGRYGYEFIDGPQRLRQPLSSADGAVPGVDEAVARAAALLRGRRIIGIGSPRASLEANAALRRLVGAERFYAGVEAREHACVAAALQILRAGPVPVPSLRDAQLADAVLILGEDVTATAPRLALALRQAVRGPALAHAESLGVPRWKDVTVREIAPGREAPLIIAAPWPTRLDDIAAERCALAPDDVARLGLAVAHALDEAAPPVPGLSAALQATAARIAAMLGRARRPLVVSGTAGVSTAVIEAAANVARALSRRGAAASLYYALPECNSMGLAMMQAPGLDAAAACLRRGEADAAVVLENDLYRRLGAAEAEAMLRGLDALVAVDYLHHPTAARADLLLPAAPFAEGDGTLVSAEGRAQRFFAVYRHEVRAVQESWRWLAGLAAAMGRHEALPVSGLDDMLALLAADLPDLAPAADAAPHAGFRVAGQRIPRQPARYSGRTAMVADVTVHEPAPAVDRDAPLAFSMEGYDGMPPPALITHAWAPRWNSVQAYNKYQNEVGGALRGGDPGVRLIEPAAASGAVYFHMIPVAFAPPAGQWLVVPRYHIFGSEELSVHGAAVAQRVPAPYVGIAPDEAARCGIAAGDAVDVEIDGAVRRLPAVLISGLPPRVAALPCLPGMGLIRPGMAVLRRAGDG